MAELNDLDLSSFDDVVNDFIRTWSAHLDDEDSWFGKEPKNLSEAIQRAARSRVRRLSDGRVVKHDHQRRIPPVVLERACKKLLSIKARIESQNTFEGLHETIRCAIIEIPGIGPLTVYDIAERLAIFMNVSTDRVYLHAGVTEGARAVLGGELVLRQFVPLSDFPEAFRVLDAFRLETLLCVYKTQLRRISTGRRAERPQSVC